MTNIFEDKTPMPPKGHNPDAVQVANTPADVRMNYMPAVMKTADKDVVNVKRPRFGHGY